MLEKHLSPTKKDHPEGRSFFASYYVQTFMITNPDESCSKLFVRETQMRAHTAEPYIKLESSVYS